MVLSKTKDEEHDFEEALFRASVIQPRDEAIKEGLTMVWGAVFIRNLVESIVCIHFTLSITR